MISNSVEETKQVVINFLEKTLFKGLGKTATIVGLHGDLGSGKTTFVQQVASALFIEEHVQSPTFVIMKNYRLTHSTFKNLIHIDAYRLKSASEIEKLGWNEIVSNPENIVFIEWPEQIGDAMPKNSLHIGFKFVDAKAREISFLN